MRRAALLAAVLFSLLVAAGCSSSSDAAADEAESSTTTAAPVATTVGATSSTTDPGEGVDAAELLSEALSRYEDGYQFAAAADVEGAQAATVTGVVIGRQAEMTITSGDATVTYIITPDQSWIRTEDGDWQEDETASSIERPLDGLAAPSSLVIVSTDDGEVNAVAVYDGVLFESEADIDMSLRFVDGLLVEASYTTDAAVVTTSFAPLDGQVIVVPVPSA